MASTARFFTAPGDASPISVCAPETVLAMIPSFLYRWQTAMPAIDAAPAIRCTFLDQRFEILASVLPEGRHLASSAVEAADIVASALAVLSVGGAEMILPHAAAVQGPAGLVLLFADTKGGKSVLALTLAAAGWRLFGDDRLGLRRGKGGSTGVALGLAPKLRLPLPDAATALKAFAGARIRQSWPSLAFLQLGAEEQAAAGVSARVAACLLLDRSGGAPALEPGRPAQLVRALAESAAAPWLGAAEVLAAAVAHADLPVLHLHYGEASKAAQVLLHRFGSRA
ncbi:MAG TPA: hypothetical protein VED46_04100 [Alphaproteobacteria bacterium]|nr:hypothetical protein [Alphaproteobacteria bacterium]